MWPGAWQDCCVLQYLRNSLHQGWMPLGQGRGGAACSITLVTHHQGILRAQCRLARDAEVLRAEAAGLADVLGAAGAEAAAASAARATLGAQLAQALQRLAQVRWPARRRAHRGNLTLFGHVWTPCLPGRQHS
jgi:hypothetical protein